MDAVEDRRQLRAEGVDPGREPVPVVPLAGLPSGSDWAWELQVRRISPKPMSLPPIVSETTRVFARSASSWGGFGPPWTCWGAVRSVVRAPLQVASVKSVRCSQLASRAG
ncbi:hypothetical protein GCM10029964_110460 [Kibdelosporangium lantanae]